MNESDTQLMAVSRRVVSELTHVSLMYLYDQVHGRLAAIITFLSLVTYYTYTLFLNRVEKFEIDGYFRSEYPLRNLNS